MVKSTLAKSLRAIAAAIESLDQHELDALIAGKGKLAFVATEKFSQRPDSQAVDIAPVLEHLGTCKDRQEARSVLAAIANKDALSSLARSMKIHVVKHDRREDIENKIVEFAIGGKLRSEAIQTLNMKGGGVQSNNG